MSWATAYIGRSDMHCWSLVCDAYASHLGITLPKYSDVDAEEMWSVARAVGEHAYVHPWYSVTPFPGGEREFDVVVMKGWLPCADGIIRRGVIHTGLITRLGHVMHTDMQHMVVEVPLNHVTVKRRLVGCYRHSVGAGG